MADVQASDDGRPDRPRRPGPAVVVGADSSWSGLPGRVAPQDWVTEQADPAVPGSVMAAETERRPEGGFRSDPAG